MTNLFARLKKIVTRTWNEPDTTRLASDGFTRYYMDLSHVERGINSEAGEITDAVKKHLDYGLPIDIDNVEEEVGDLLYYTFKLCSILGISFESAVDCVEEKLQKRYPEGFTVEGAAIRADKDPDNNPS